MSSMESSPCTVTSCPNINPTNAPRSRTKHRLGEKRRHVSDSICPTAPLPTTRKRHLDWNRDSNSTAPQPSVHTSHDDSPRPSTDTIVVSQASALSTSPTQDMSSTIPPQFSPVLPTVKRYSSQSMSVPAVVIESPSVDDANGGGPSPPQKPPIETDAPGVASSLTALKNSGVSNVVP